MQPAKNILTVFLLAAFSIPLVLPFFLQLQQQYVKWEMLEQLETKETITIRVKATEVFWVKQNKECVIAGEMFDVKKIEKHNDELILTGLFDKKEKAIKKQLEDIAGKGNDPISKQKIKPFSLLLYFTAIDHEVFSILLKGNTNFFYKQSYYTPPFKGYITPPPREV